MRTRPAIPNHIARTVLAAIISLIAPALANAEDIVLPYTCQMSGGRPTLTTSSPHRHPIVGRREDRRVTICSPADPDRCRAWTAHRFDMLCSGVEVPWATVVANSPPARGGNAWIEGGRFRLTMPPAWALPTDNPCSRLIDDADPGLARYCANQPPPIQPVYAEMPPGFAPMFGLNGTFTASAAPAEIANNAPRQDALPPAMTPSGNLNWRASPTAPPKAPPPQPGETPLPSAAAKSKSAPADLPPLKPAIAPTRDEPPARETRPPASAPLPPLPSRTVETVAPQAMAPIEPARSAKPEPKPEPAKPEPPKSVAPPAQPPAPVAALPAPVPPAPAPSPAVSVPAAPAPTPALAPTATPPTLPPAQSATAEPSTNTQVAANRAATEPYSSRPVKIANPDSDLRTGLMITAGVALTLTLAGAAFFWRRRQAATDPDEPSAAPYGYTQRGDDPPALDAPRAHTTSFRDDVRLPGLSDTPRPALPPSNDPFDRAMPAFADDTAPARPSSRSSTGHTLSMAYDDGVRTHLDADLPYEDAPVVHIEPELTFETLPSDTPQTALANKSHLAPAAPSWSGAAGWPTEMPQTRGDALYILGMGVTTRAKLPAMKKIVDGLRMSWHPDHATDDADRAIRELRIRQINTAWDLIAASDPNPDDDPVI